MHQFKVRLIMEMTGHLCGIESESAVNSTFNFITSQHFSLTGRAYTIPILLFRAISFSFDMWTIKNKIVHN